MKVFQFDDEAWGLAAVLSKPETFEDNAIRCEQRRAETARPDLMVLYRDLAAQWRDLAIQVRLLREGEDAKRQAPDTNSS